MNGAKRSGARLPREVVYHALRDRQWHRLGDLYEELGALVPPENAARAFRKNTKRPSEYSERYQVEHGRNLVVSQSMTDAGRNGGRLELAGPRSGPDRRVRLIGWYCASCGKFISEAWETRPPHSCCQPCVKGGTPCESQD